MGVILVPKRRTTQPQGVVQLAPWAAGAFVITPAAVLNGSLQTANGHAFPTAASPGRGFSFGSAVFGDVYDAAKTAGRTAYTVFAYVTFTGSGVYQSPIDSDKSGGRAFQFRRSPGGAFEIIGFNTTVSSTPAAVAPGTVPTGTPALLVGRFAGNTITAFYNGGSGSNTITGTPQSSQATIGLGASYVGTTTLQSNDLDGIVWMAGVIPRALSDADIKRWQSGSPWQIFAPHRSYIPTAAASGLPTLSAAGMTGITTTGGYPTVSYAY